MALDDPILAFLALPENLRLAIDISRQLERLKNDIRLLYWERIGPALMPGYEEKVDPVFWKLDIPTEGFERDWLDISLKPRAEMPLSLRVTLQPTSGRWNYAVRFGVSWSDPKQPRPPLEALGNIRNYMATYGFRQDANWPGFKEPFALWEVSFMERLANEPDALLAEIADSYWSLFEDLEPDLVAANRALADM